MHTDQMTYDRITRKFGVTRTDWTSAETAFRRCQPLAIGSSAVATTVRHTPAPNRGIPNFVRERDRPVGGSHYAIYFGSDGPLLAGDGKPIGVSELATGRELRSFGNGALAISFSPDGQLLASFEILYDDGRPSLKRSAIHLWDVATGRLTNTLALGNIFATRLAFSPDGRLLAASGKGVPNVRVFEVSSGREVRAWNTEQPIAWSSLVFSPDGRLLAAGVARSGAVLWDLGSGEAIRSMRGVSAATGIFDDLVGQSSVAFSGDGAWIASASDTGIRLWDLASGQETKPATRFEQSKGVSSLAFSPDGAWLVSGGADGYVTFWDVATGRSVKRQGLTTNDRAGAGLNGILNKSVSTLAH